MKNLNIFSVGILTGMLLLTRCQPTESQTTETLVGTSSPPETDSRAAAEITFIDNAGFLITSGEYKILIDALFDADVYSSSTPEEILRQMIEGDPPFDGVDLILITHDHTDHFWPDYVLEFMQNNPGPILVSTKAVVDHMMTKDASLEDRMIPIDLAEGETEELVAAGIELEALNISHGIPDLINLGFIINLPEVKLFHTGDMSAEDVNLSDLMTFGLHRKRIDVAFLPLYLFEDVKFQAHIEQGIQAKHLIPMHYPCDEPPLAILENFPEAILFSDSLEVWELPLEQTTVLVSGENASGTISESSLGEIVTFTTEEEIPLSGILMGEGEVAVILAHQGTYPADQTTWQPFAQVLANEGFTVLTFDFRGRGQSGGRFVAPYLINDVNAAIAYLRERGYEKIICAGASMGGTSCLRAALDDELLGVVVFASTLSLGDPTSVRIEELTNLSIPKLFLTGEKDSVRVVRDIEAMYENSPEPKEIHIFEGMSQHGTDLFNTDVGDELTNLLLSFIKDLAD